MFESSVSIFGAFARKTLGASSSIYVALQHFISVYTYVLSLV